MRWQCVVQNLLDDGGVGSGVIRQQGPAFVDPYDPKMIFVSLRGAAGLTNTLQASFDGGTNFCQLPVLKALVTESGRYDLLGSYDPDDVFEAASSRFHGFPLSVPSYVAFNRQIRSQFLVGSPFTGLYWGTASADGKSPGVCAESWTDLTPYLPVARSYISATAIFGNNAIVATEGRGVYSVSDLNAAQPASYFETQSSAVVAGRFAILHRGNGAVMPWGAVLVTGRSLAPSSAPIVERIRSDQFGRLFLPNGFVGTQQYIMDLKFLGDGAVTPSTVKFELTVD